MTNLQCCPLSELTLFGEYEVNRSLSNFTEDHTNTAVSTNDNKDFWGSFGEIKNPEQLPKIPEDSPMFLSYQLTSLNVRSTLKPAPVMAPE